MAVPAEKNNLEEKPLSRKRFFKSFEAKSLRKRSYLTRISDKLTAFCGSTYFLVFHVIFFSVWIAVNTGQIPGVAVYDPFPYGLLTMVVSLEAIFLAIFVLVSQNRQANITTVRDEVNMKVNLIAEEEITKILQLLAEMRAHMGIKGKDEVLEQMLKKTDTGDIEQSILEQLQRADKPISPHIPAPIDVLKMPIHALTHVVMDEVEEVKKEKQKKN
jgi:uncharacterized membrane protein